MGQSTMLMADQDALQAAKAAYDEANLEAERIQAGARDRLNEAIRRAATNGATQTGIALVLGDGWPKQRVNRVLKDGA